MRRSLQPFLPEAPPLISGSKSLSVAARTSFNITLTSDYKNQQLVVIFLLNHFFISDYM